MSNCLSCGCGLATCGCCAGIETVTPKTVGNPPGRSALDVRIGRHGDFLASMLARLSSHRDEDHSAPLELLRTREPDDLTISLLDGLAAAGDVLTFYNERIANEGYLPTATDNRSVEALAQLVGYRPQPGVAASVFLAFGIDPNTTDPVRIDKGLGVKTVPAQDELPQIFETSEALEARAAWNQLGLRKTLPQMINPMAAGSLWLAGTDANLAIGDALLIETSAKSVPAPVRVLEVITDPDAQLTKVRFEPWAAAALNDPDLAELIAKGARFIDDDLVAVLEAAEELQDSPRAGSAAPLLMLARDARARAESVEGPQIKAFIERIAERAEKLAGEVPLGPTAETAAPHEAVPFDDRLKRLSAPPAPVLASAARIVRQTTDSFRETAAAPLAIVARTAPVAGPQLGDALAGYRAAAPEAPLKVYAMRVRSGVFGRTFPKRMQATRDANGAVGEMTEIGEWPIVDANRKRTWIRHEKPSVITLDAVHDGIAPQSWVMVDMRGLNRVGKDLMVRVGPADPVVIVRAIEVLPKIARADYGGSGESTAIRLPGDQPWLVYAKPKDFANVSPNDQDMIDREFGLIRRTTVYAAPEELPLAQQPIEEPLCVDKDAGFVVELDALYADLEAGRYVIVSGERADIPETEGITASEVAMIAGVSHDVRRLPPDANGRRLPVPGESNHTFITFAAPLAYCYKRATVTISGNVVKATHGETRREVLGSGDASKPNLSLPLKQAPLTFVAAPTARGAEAALEIWVDDIRWREADDLVDAPPTARLYQLRTAEGGKAEIQFGDGKEGARPSTGTQNIRSVYRTGIGQPGNASARQINQLVSRPAGLRDVVNPLPATGGADPEDRDQIRRNAPLATMALDRLVSVEDHANFARSFAGIAKARARMMSDGARRFVHLTVAAEDDAPLDPGSDLMLALKRALVRYGDPYSPVILAPRELRLMIVAARVAIEPDRRWETVVGEIRRRLAERFGFDRRDIAAGVAASAVLAVIQATPGVAYVDLDTFGSIPTVGGDAGKRTPLGPVEIAKQIALVTQNRDFGWEPAQPARRGNGGILAAELLLLAPDIPDTLILNELR